MEYRDGSLWSQIISKTLRTLVPGAPDGVSAPFVEQVPFEDCGEFVWALVCISRAAPADMLDRYSTGYEAMEEEQANRLLRGALSAPDFYGFSEGSLTRTLLRLGRNIDSSLSEEAREAHRAALDRIEHIVLFLAAEHPNAVAWLKTASPEPVQSVKRDQPQVPALPRLRRPRPAHLRLVQG